MTNFFIVYGVLALSHIVIQMIFAIIERRRQSTRSTRLQQAPSIYFPTVAVVMTVYNEDPELLFRAASSVLTQVYQGKFHLFIMDDGSKNIHELADTYMMLSDQGAVVNYHSNVGKRQAQYNTVKLINERYPLVKPDILVTMDSDTVLAYDALDKIVTSFENKNVGAATGEILALNRGDNFLTKLIYYRYWLAFNQERAAQSLFNTVTCCSGPFSAYRWEVFDEVKKDYIKQRFLGKTCTYGDDRHLTNLVLKAGYEVVYNPDATADTEVPTTIRAYLKQQLRWNKSFYREMLWTPFSWSPRRWYMAYDLLMQLILPPLLIVALVHVVILSWQSPIFLLYYLVVMLLIAMLRISYGFWYTRDLQFLRFLVYGIFHVLVLIPNRLYALATIRDRRWGTR